MGNITLSGYVHTNTGNEPSRPRTINVYENAEDSAYIIRSFTTTANNGSWVLYNVITQEANDYWVKCEGLDTDDAPYVYTATGGNYGGWEAGTDDAGNGEYYGWNTNDDLPGNVGMTFQETS